MLRVLDRQLDVRLVILDKDGTLLAFDVMWHTWFANLLQALNHEGRLAAETLAGLAATLGYDPATGAWDPLGALTVAPTAEVLVLIAGQLCAHERAPYDDALARVRRAQRYVQQHSPLEDLAQPIGDLHGWLQRVRASGALLALATTDLRAETERALARLGVLDLFATSVCGDDGVPLKPDAQMALEICRRTGVPPEQAIMVGDTVADLQMARAAGLACAIGVTSGGVPAALLAPYADVLIADIHAIEPVAQPTQARTP
ncbi:MAG: HAD family hydrolase [Chloroflexi bacterium]|nr:HAD family hydrolase [Chloroflexota bacterium]